MARRSAVVALALGLGAVGLVGSGGELSQAARGHASVAGTAGQVPPQRGLVCKLPSGSKRLPPTARHGLVGHLRQYPVVPLATPRERTRARRALATLVSAARTGGWRDLRAAARAGYGTRTAPRKPGDRSVRYFHSERHEEPRGRTIFAARRPKALIYANAPGRPLVLVGAMWSTRDGERGPTPAGPIMRWHSHVVCAKPHRRGIKPLPGGRCRPGEQLIQGRSEMLHVWFTGDLRSAFAIRGPEPELCTAGLLPAGHCRRSG